LNTDQLSGYGIKESILDVVADAQAKEGEEYEAKTISAAEYDRRTKLDVSDSQYINSSLDTFKKGK